jgi:copper oxidase (laccase) domain-containing protein
LYQPAIVPRHKARVAGAAHAGWKGALTGILEATVAKMEEVGAARYARVETVDDLCCDTYSEENDFFSFRRSVHRHEPDYGRLVAAIAIAE